MDVLTIGHSTRPIEGFLHLLKHHRVQRLVDVRTVPKSRYNPQFETNALADSLKQAQIEYLHMPTLGGLRHARKDSVNTGWRNDSFRGYADCMQTPEFEEALLDLIRLADDKRTVIMCAEAVPWRCHRSLIADALLARGIQARHILNETEPAPHSLTSFAKVNGTAVTYPPDSLRLDF